MAPMWFPRRAVALVGAVTMAGCAASADSGARADASASPEQALAAASSAASSVAPSAEPTIIDVEHLVDVDEPGPDGALGAGCDVPEDGVLSDGSWYGFVVKYAVSSVTLDIACAYGPGTDQFQAFAAAGDGAEYVVVNDVVDEHSVRLTSDTEVMLDEDGWEPLVPNEARHALDPQLAGEQVAVWVCVEDGEVARVVQAARLETLEG
ncbi:hypothetical protein [Demequina sp. NBRC 110053]|uniref:hypothetical protein n=1 Tax=Demequina sp. NBRC 110053 TaxID=1570342 RepID=UPI0011866B23|nr:hypothetical protein [Demequina sp. NBRC 110053]